MAPVRCSRRPDSGLWSAIDHLLTRVIELVSHLVAIFKRACKLKSSETTTDVTPIDGVKTSHPDDPPIDKQCFVEEISESGAGVQVGAVTSSPSYYKETALSWKCDVSRPIKGKFNCARAQEAKDIRQMLLENGEEPKVDDGPPPMLPEYEEPPSNDAYLEPEQPPPPHAPMQETMKAVEATTDTDEMYCIVTSKGLWLVAFDGSVGPTFIAYPQQMNETASNPHYGPPPAISTQSAKNTKPDSSKKTSTVTEPIDDQQVGNFAENDPVAKPLSNEDKHAAGESPESPGSKRSADVHERLPPDKRSQMLPPTAGPKNDKLGAAQWAPAYTLESFKDSGQEQNTAGSRPTVQYHARDQASPNRMP